MTTLAQPFVPIRFQDDEPGHPFTERVGHRGRVVVFGSQYRSADDWSEGLLADLAFLTSVEWGECAYGAADYPMYGFVCEFPPPSHRQTEWDVLRALSVATFLHNPSAARETVDIHAIFADQYLFDREAPEAENAEPHGALKRYVTCSSPVYLLLHIGKRPCQMVVLLAVGTSPNGDRLVGAITSQMCHSLCD